MKSEYQREYQRIACLSTEAVEVLYAIGAEDLIAGISGYTVRPARARQEKPKISGFSTGKVEKILAVQPDLVIAYSNLQSELCRDLIATGIEVHAYNQRDVAGIFRMIRSLSALAGREEQGRQLIAMLEDRIAAVKAQAAGWSKRPKIYFEEWDEPMMSAIGWVSELIQIAGGVDIFSELAQFHSASQRIVADPQEVVRRAPDIIIGSWCGKKFRPETVLARPDWNAIPAVRNDRLFEIKSPDILSPGPAAIEHGLMQLHLLIADWQASQIN